MMAQSLEYSLVALFGFNAMSDGVSSDDQLRKILDTRFNQTLGRLVHDAAKYLNISPEFAAELEAALKMRNWVVHHFFREYGALSSSPSLLNEATTGLEKIWPLFSRTADRVHKLVIEKQLEQGKTKEQIEAEIEERIRSFLSEKGYT